MTSTNALPIPRPLLSPQGHEHSWLTESRHPTSEGIIVYVRCGACAARRVDLQPSATVSNTTMPPIALSRSLGEATSVTP